MGGEILSQETKTRKEKALEAILAVIPGLKYYEWGQIAQHVEMAYSSRTTKVELDGSDADRIRRNFKRDYLS